MTLQNIYETEIRKRKLKLLTVFSRSDNHSQYPITSLMVFSCVFIPIFYFYKKKKKDIIFCFSHLIVIRKAFHVLKYSPTALFLRAAGYSKYTNCTIHLVNPLQLAFTQMCYLQIHFILVLYNFVIEKNSELKNYFEATLW